MSPKPNEPKRVRSGYCFADRHGKCESERCSCYCHRTLRLVDEEVGYDHGGVSER